MDDKFVFKKSLGQNFLNDKNVIQNIIDSAKIDKDTLVIEIGPGGGALSKYIVPLSGFSLLYEADSRLESKLKYVLSDFNNFSLFIGDFLNVNLKNSLNNNFSKLYVVANLPYYITTPIIIKFIDENILPDKFVIMIQKEVASRLSAKPNNKDYGALTVFLNYFYNIKKLFDVSRNCFVPKPNVDSSVICMELNKDRKKIKDIELFKKIVRDSFRFKRKNLRNNLSYYNLDVISGILSKYGFDLTCRAENLDLDVFIDIANHLCKE